MIKPVLNCGDSLKDRTVHSKNNHFLAHKK